MTGGAVRAARLALLGAAVALVGLPAAADVAPPPEPSLGPLPVPPAEPPVPAAVRPSFGPDAVRVGLVDSGVDYRLPVVRDALLRHVGGAADGVPVGIDFRDLDHRPFDAVPAGPGRVRRHGTAVATALLAEAPDVAFVPYRYPGQDMRLMHALVEHAAAHGVRVLGLPLGGDREAQWDAFAAAARAHPEMLFVASAGNDGRDLDARPLYPASLPLDNLVTVTSADDFGLPSPESGTGRRSVDYLVPAEAVRVTGFGGESRTVAGSSYAVPRLVALAARLLATEPSLDAAGVVRAIRREHGNGLRPVDVASGLVADPLQDTVGALDTAPMAGVAGVATRLREAARAPTASTVVPIDLFALDPSWDDERAARAVESAARILATCDVALVPARVERVSLDGAAQRLRDLEPGAARTLFERLGRTGSARRATVVLARDTRMATAFDAEAFGLANTRHRSWLAHSVWLTAALEDDGIALAHELWHVLANSGEHSDAPGNLMRARTTGDNTALTRAQCERARDGARVNALAER